MDLKNAKVETETVRDATIAKTILINGRKIKKKIFFFTETMLHMLVAVNAVFIRLLQSRSFKHDRREHR